MKLNLNDIVVSSYDPNPADTEMFAMAACTPTLDSLVDAICPDGLTVGCHETTVA